MDEHDAGQAGLSRSRRRWRAAATLLCAVLTLAGLAYVYPQRSVWWSRVDVQFNVPKSSDSPNPLNRPTRAMVMTAGAVGRMVDPSGGKRLLADDTVSLASEGITRGWAVTLPNSGSQWITVFGTPQLQVEAVGPTPDDVNRQMAMVLRRVRAALATLQAGSPRIDDVTLFITPQGDAPMYLQSGSRARALIGVLILSTIGTLLVRYLFTRRWGAGPADTPPPDELPVGGLTFAFSAGDL